MTELDNYIKRIQTKLQSLLKHYDSLQKENRTLHQELGATQQKLSQQQKNIEELKQQLTVLKLASADPDHYRMNEVDKREFEKRINGYIREIDRCIAMLGK